MEAIWEEVQGSLREKLGSQNYEIWIRPIQVAEFSGDRVQLVVPNKYYRDWVQANYGATLCEEIGVLVGHSVTVQFVIGGVADSDEAADPTRHGLNGQAARNGRPAPHNGIPSFSITGKEPAPLEAPPPPLPPIAVDKTFANFVVGSCNEFAQACAEAVANFPADVNHNPLFIYAGTGLGKTHLLLAIANRIRANDPAANVLYVTGEQFTNTLIEALRYNRMEEFRDRFRRIPTILLMDDVQFIAGKDRTQEELFHTFEELKKVGRQIVFTSDVLPREMKGFEPRLRTRCESGMIADIGPPDMETLLAILHRKAGEQGLVVPPDLAEFIAARIRGNIRELEGVLHRLGALCRLYGAQPTLAFAQHHLASSLAEETRTPSADEVIQMVAAFYNVKLSDLKGTRRHKPLVRPRHVAMWLVRKHSHLSFPDIGRVFGRDHATVQHACKKIKNELARDADLRTAVEALTRGLIV